MNPKYRKTMIAGNWKMNMTPAETKQFAETLKTLLPAEPACKVVLCVPSIDIPAASEAFADSIVAIGAQNVYDKEKGAYTGEISPLMLKECGVQYVIVGHSERRGIFGESDEMIQRKVRTVLDHGMHPILCVGESLEQREAGVTMEHITGQVKSALEEVSAEEVPLCVIAYEPIWAIGTGKTATGEQAAEVCGSIRNVLRDLYNEETARSVTIQYGGSMNPGNAAELLSHEDIDGGLIGGASLKPEQFIAIIDAAK